MYAVPLHPIMPESAKLCARNINTPGLCGLEPDRDCSFPEQHPVSL